MSQLDKEKDLTSEYVNSVENRLELELNNIVMTLPAKLAVEKIMRRNWKQETPGTLDLKDIQQAAVKKEYLVEIIGAFVTIMRKNMIETESIHNNRTKTTKTVQTSEAATQFPPWPLTIKEKCNICTGEMVTIESSLCMKCEKTTHKACKINCHGCKKGWHKPCDGTLQIIRSLKCIKCKEITTEARYAAEEYARKRCELCLSNVKPVNGKRVINSQKVEEPQSDQNEMNAPSSNGKSTVATDTEVNVDEMDTDKKEILQEELNRRNVLPKHMKPCPFLQRNYCVKGFRCDFNHFGFEHKVNPFGQYNFHDQYGGQFFNPMINQYNQQMQSQFPLTPKYPPAGVGSGMNDGMFQMRNAIQQKLRTQMNFNPFDKNNAWSSANTNSNPNKVPIRSHNNRANSNSIPNNGPNSSTSANFGPPTGPNYDPLALLKNRNQNWNSKAGTISEQEDSSPINSLADETVIIENLDPSKKGIECKFFRNGQCMNGKRCEYSHKIQETQMNNQMGEITSKAFEQTEITLESGGSQGEINKQDSRLIDTKMVDEFDNSFFGSGPSITSTQANSSERAKPKDVTHNVSLEKRVSFLSIQSQEFMEMLTTLQFSVNKLLQQSQS